MSITTKSPVASGPSAAKTRRGERIAKLGTIVSAILATSCCWGPLVLLGLGLLGVSTAGLARMMRLGLETYRPVFMVVTFAFLGLAFYFTYRPRRAAPAAAGAEDC
jgi:hypothetical protein